MKIKKGSIWRVGAALMLAMSLSIITATPAAANVSGVTATPSTIVTSTNATYTINFTINSSLDAITGTITADFPAGTVLAATGDWANGAVTVNENAVAGGDVTVAGTAVTIKSPVALVAPTAVGLVISSTGVTNSGTEGTNKVVKVKTSSENTYVDSATFTLSDLPTITSVGGSSGNRGENLTVVIAGDDLTGATTVTFTNGVTVTGIAVTNDTTLSANITIPSDATLGSANVTVTTAVGSNIAANAANKFTVNAAGTNKADVFSSAGAFRAQYGTIQAAINDGSTVTGDVLKVHAGIYSETVTVSKDLTIESYMGAASTNISSTGATITVTANGITIGGTNKGFIIQSTSTSAPVVNLGTTSGGVIDGNTIYGATGTTPDGGLLRIGVQDVNYGEATIKNNTFLGLKSLMTTQQVPAIGVDARGSIIENNSFPAGDGSTTQAVDSGIWVNQAYQAAAGGAAATTLTIRNNTFTGASGKRVDPGDPSSTMGAGAIELYNIDGSVVISGNTIQNANDGIYFGSGSNLAAGVVVTIKQNTISGNTWGIESKAEGTGTIVAKYNDITGNTGWGLLQVYRAGDPDDIVVNAQHNWWGSASGPLHTTSNPNGQGNKVGRDNASGQDANYSPWLGAAQSGIVSALRPQYASSIIVSAANAAVQTGNEWNGGWTTFSPSIALDGAGDTWGEVTTLANLQYNVAYSWDGTNFVQLTSDSAISPLNPVFIQLKTSATQSLPVLYNTTLTAPPSRALSAGWQLIGTARLSATGAMDRDSEFVSIASKYSQAINPIGGAILNGTDGEVTIGRGYWAFMTSSGTLAGFSVTPVDWVAVP